jgi:putative FmdB family regulatory protein
VWLIKEAFQLPLYEYKCGKCGHQFEKIENISASTIKKCPQCGGKAERMLAAPAIQFKGSGWYVTDYAGKNAGGNKSDSSDDKKSGEKPASASGSNSGKKTPAKEKTTTKKE